MNTVYATISAALFYIFPTLLGAALMPKKVTTQRLNMFTLMFSYCFGALVLYLSLAGITLSGQALRYQTISLLTARPYLISLAIILSVVTLLRYRIVNIPKSNLHILFAGLLAVVAYVIWRFNSPMSNPLNWDIHEHQVLATIIQNGVFSFRTSTLSDTFLFNGYTTMFHTLLAISQSFALPAIAGNWWVVESLHLFTTICASWALGWAVTGNKSIGAISAILGAFVFESAVAYSSIFLIPQTLSAMIGTMTLAYILLQDRLNAPVQPFFIIISFITMGLMHFIIGSAWIGVLLLVILAIHKKHAIQKYFTPPIMFTAVGFIICALGLLSTYVDPNTFVFGQAKMFTYAIEQNITFLMSYYSYSLFLLYPLGLYASFKNRNFGMLLLSVISLLLFLVILFPLPYVLKFYAINRYAVHAVMAYGIWHLVKQAPVFARLSSIVLLAVTMVCVYSINTFQWKEQTEISSVATHISAEERAAISYLRSQPHDGALLVSDPATQYIMEPEAGLNSQGGAYMNERSRSHVRAALQSESNEEFRKSLFAIQDTVLLKKPTKIYFVVSARSMSWQTLSVQDQNNLGINVWGPKAFSLKDIGLLESWEKQIQITPMFSNNGVRIYSISRI